MSKSQKKKENMLHTFRINHIEFKMVRFNMSCGLREFLINNETADVDDFVEYFDHSPASAPDYGCGNKCADILPATDIVLKKYGITNDEYDEIASELQSELSIGMCSMCA